MKIPTIYDIKYDIQEKSPYFFSRKTLQFFNQTMKDFMVRKSPRNRIFIIAASYWHNRLMGYIFREYVDHNLIQVNGVDDHDADAILNYIHTH